jgi:hypothetical protein
MKLIQFPKLKKSKTEEKKTEKAVYSVEINYTNVDYVAKSPDGKAIIHYKSGLVQPLNNKFEEIKKQMFNYLRNILK